MVNVGLTPDRASLLIRFQYDPRLVDLTRRLPGRRFHKALGGWTVPLTSELVAELPSRYPGVNVTLLPEVQQVLNRQEEAGKASLWVKDQAGAELELPEGMVFPTTQPRDHQRKALSLFAKREKYGFFLQMGTGKTFVILAGLRWLREIGDLRPTLIVCPGSVLSVWEDQAREHQPDLKLQVLTGPISKRIAQLQAGWANGTEIFVTNYEAVWRMEILQKIPWRCMVLDESTRIKSRTTKQSKAILKLSRNVKRRYILTGTPMPNSPTELYSQFLFLDPAILGGHFFAFRDRYCIMGGYQGYQVVSYKNVPELSEKISKNSYRVLKKDCLDLPEKVYSKIPLSLEGDQKKSYEELAKNLVTEVAEKQVTAPVLISKLIKLKEILAGFIKADDGTIIRLKQNVKMDALKDIIEDLPSDRKIVIWTYFREEIKMVSELVDPAATVILSGDTPLDARGVLVKRFQEDPKCRFFIGQQKAGGLGITLTAANYCVFLTNDYSPEVRLQAEDRLHRIGQVNKVTYYDLVCKATLDVVTLSMLRRKVKLSDLLTGDNLKQVIEGVEDIE